MYIDPLEELEALVSHPESFACILFLLALSPFFSFFHLRVFAANRTFIWSPPLGYYKQQEEPEIARFHASYCSQPSVALHQCLLPGPIYHPWPPLIVVFHRSLTTVPVVALQSWPSNPSGSPKPFAGRGHKRSPPRQPSNQRLV